MLDATTTNQIDSSGVLPPAQSNPQRPAYHFMPAANWMNDPNGLIYWNNQYHLFYQYNPTGPFWGTIHWGHTVSDDLVHWHDLPIALAPTAGGPDSDGCWSGCAVDNDGVPTLVYTGVRGQFQLPCLAIGSNNLQTWTKYEGNPVLPGLPPGLDLVAFRDPMVWREGEEWYMLVGSGIKGVGGTALLFHSPNLTDWNYLHPINTGDINQTGPFWSGSLWECPQLLPLGDKYLLTFGVWDSQPRYALGQIGTYVGQHFTPEGAYRLDFGDAYFYAPQTMVDAKGRAIMWGWIQEGWNESKQLAAGWAGVMSLPRILSLLPDGKLGIEPAPELKALRGFHHAFEQFYLSAHSGYKLKGVAGDCLEIAAEIALDAQAQFKIAVRCSPDEEEQTIISYDPTQEWLELDTSRSSRDSTGALAPLGGRLTLVPPELLRLHIFIDRSVIEIFANGRACITGRIYPGRSDSLDVVISTPGDGGARISVLDVWELT